MDRIFFFVGGDGSGFSLLKKFFFDFNIFVVEEELGDWFEIERVLD